MTTLDDNPVLWQLFRDGPTWDDDIISKSNRNELFDSGHVHRVDGWSYLTYKGIVSALKLKMNRRKEKEQH